MDGIQFEHNGNSNKGEICDIVIGFDLGTSCSKVVLQTPYHASGRTVLVSFGNFGHPMCPYFLPTRLYFDQYGNCSLISNSHPYCAKNLKVNLLQNPDETKEFAELKVSPRSLTIAYLALAFQDIRQWFAHTQKNIYDQYKFRWYCNLGIPSPGYNDSDRRNLFRRIAIIAWQLSLSSESISLKKIWQLLKEDHDCILSLDFHPDQIQVVPEIVAEIIGYAKSHLRENGLHVLIDIGASTIDISGFILHDRDREDRYSFLTSDLDFLGAYYCHKERVKKIQEYVNRWFSHLARRQDLIMPVEPTIADYFPKYEDFGPNGEKDILSEFYEKCRIIIHRTLKSLRKERDPLSENWKLGLPIFLCGGGKALPIYRQVLEELNGFWQTNMDTKGFEIRSLPKPSNLVADGLSEKNFDRFAVAYGLSYPYYDVGEITPPGKIQNVFIDRTPKYDHIEFISKDMV